VVNTGTGYSIADAHNPQTTVTLTSGDAVIQAIFTETQTLGVAVSSDGSTIIVGAYGDDDNGSDSGSVSIIPLE
jgi:hypothetical protein